MKLIEISDPIGYNTVLNPKIWDHKRMRSEVRGALLRIAEDFIKFVNVDFPILDIVITGGNANYNYTIHSDIDLHIITDYNQVGCDKGVEDEMFDAKRRLYNRKYDLKINGIQVELYVEDQSKPAVSNGSYSVANEKWISRPNSNIPTYDKDELAHMVKVWETIFDHVVKSGDLQDCRNAVKLLRTYRQKGLNTSDAEFSIPNLVYKSLRNSQHLDHVLDLIDKLHDQELSLK